MSGVRRVRGTVTINQVGCARCGGDGHVRLTFQSLTIPHECAPGEVMTHWAPCPTNGEPILLGFVERGAASGLFGSATDGLHNSEQNDTEAA